MVWNAGGARRCLLRPRSASCWHLAANIAAHSVHTNVNIHKKAFTRRQTLNSHTAEFSVWENADLPPYHNHITRWTQDKTTVRLWRNGTHSRYASRSFGREPGLQPNPVSRLWPRCWSRWETATLCCSGSKVRLEAQDGWWKVCLVLTAPKCNFFRINGCIWLQQWHVVSPEVPFLRSLSNQDMPLT